MKKNISINISGIIFHIEEDGYDNLRKYLDSINRYFSSFDDSSEILADIESRIAEIFLSKLNEGKQVITSEDVNSLIATMGSVSDFKAVEDQAFVHDSTSEEQSTSTSGNSAYKTRSYGSSIYTKPLLRDQKRKIFGGVCAGVASYLNVDAVWIRLLFSILSFVYGTGLIIYFIIWIIVPGSYELNEPEVTKKMYRDPQRKVIAGVSGGLATFLGIDIVVIRVLFIVFTFTFGIGALIYIVFWGTLPEARTLTDKMQMQGEPVTLLNIETSIKRYQGIPNTDEETTINKILLFPFRLIGWIIKALEKILMPIIEVLRVAIGVLVSFLGLSLLLSLFVVGGLLLGILSEDVLPGSMGNGHATLFLPSELLSNTAPTITTVAACVVTIIPCVFILLLGFSLIAKRIVFKAALSWTLLVLFFCGIAVLGFTVPRIILAFQDEGEYKTEKSYKPSGKKLILKVSEGGTVDNYKAVKLTIKGTEEKEIKLIQTFESRGSSTWNAIENAQMVSYNAAFQDSILTFDSNISFNKDAVFRAQALQLTLYVPYNFPFVMNKDMGRFISHYIDKKNMDGNAWKTTPTGLECINCPSPVKTEDTRTSDLINFNAVDIHGAADVSITNGNTFLVEFKGDERQKEKYDVYTRGNTLVVDYMCNDKFFDNFLNEDNQDNGPLRINITMPQLEKLEVSGAGNVKFNDFNTTNMEIDVQGAVKVSGELKAENIDIEINGASSVELKGDSKNMEANINGTSSLNAYTLEVVDANIEASGASNAKVNVTGTLQIDASIACDVQYRGHPNVIKND